jgi:hypothetical protein
VWGGRVWEFRVATAAHRISFGMTVVKAVTTDLTGRAIEVRSGRGEYPLPGPLPGRRRVLGRGPRALLRNRSLLRRRRSAGRTPTRGVRVAGGRMPPLGREAHAALPATNSIRTFTHGPASTILARSGRSCAREVPRGLSPPLAPYLPRLSRVVQLLPDCFAIIPAPLSMMHPAAREPRFLTRTPFAA